MIGRTGLWRLEAPSDHLLSRLIRNERERREGGGRWGGGGKRGRLLTQWHFNVKPAGLTKSASLTYSVQCQVGRICTGLANLSLSATNSVWSSVALLQGQRLHQTFSTGLVSFLLRGWRLQHWNVQYWRGWFFLSNIILIYKSSKTFIFLN